MKLITTVLKSSEVGNVRKAVTVAGAERVVVSMLVRRNRAIELGDWYDSSVSAGQDDPVRVEVMVDDNQADSVVSAIIATARFGKIEKITLYPVKAHPVSSLLSRQAA